MSTTAARRIIVIVDDDHEYKEMLRRNLSEFVVRLWGCTKTTCKTCEADQPFSGAVDFIHQVDADPNGRLVAIVLDANETRDHDEYSISHILPAIKEDARLVGVPKIVYSARGKDGWEGRAQTEGACDTYDRRNTPLKAAADIIRKHALP